MSDIQELIHKTSMDCIAKGQAMEQERILKLLAEQTVEVGICCDGCSNTYKCCHNCEAECESQMMTPLEAFGGNAITDAEFISLIKGEANG